MSRIGEKSGDSTVAASGDSTVAAYGDSTVAAYGDSTVAAYSDSTVAAVEGLISPSSLHTLGEAQADDPQLGPVIDALKGALMLPSTTVPGLRKAFLQDGLLCRKFRASSQDSVHTQLVVPRSHVEMILKQLHNDSGHLAVHRITEKVKERFYWPGYEADIERWVKECQQCQKRNPPQPQPRAPLGLIKSGYPFDVISWDIMGPLPLPTSTKGNKYILVVTDLFSKWVEAFPLVATDSETLASVLVDEVVCRYGVPRVLHSDQGANLNSQVIVALCKLLGINKTRTLNSLSPTSKWASRAIQQDFGGYSVQSSFRESEGLRQPYS